MSIAFRARTESPAETQRIARALGPLLEPGDGIALVGPLGAGKTCFVKGLALGLGLDPDEVTSPTFVLVAEHKGGRLALYHVDLYRIQHPAELRELGLEELFESGGASCVEWADRFPEWLPQDWLRVEIELDVGDRRTVRGEGSGPRAERLIAGWTESIQS